MKLLNFATLSALAALVVSPAWAAAPAVGGNPIIGQLLFFIPLILIFYFLLIRPQQQQRKRHQEMIAAVKRGDMVVTSGGLIGKVTKASDDELTVELADSVRVRIRRAFIADVPEKSAPVAAND
ncbi:MAG: preprotein translocase subunit YajC [Pseudomonadota bacterium]